MILRDYVWIILSDMKRRKFSTILTLLAITLGILAIFVILMLGQGFENSVGEAFNQFGANKLFVSPKSGYEIQDNDVRFISSKVYVESTYSLYADSAEIEYGNEKKVKSMYGTQLSKDFFDDFNIGLAEGRFPKENEKYSLVVGPDFASDFFSKEAFIGSNLYVRGVKFKIVGILDSLGNPEDDSQVYFNIDTLRDLFGRGDSVDQVFVVVKEGYDVRLAADNLQLALDNKIGDEAVDIQTSDQILDQFSEVLFIIQAVLGVIAFISLIVGAFGIINTMYVIVTEKTKDIGIMKAIGATNGNILFMFMFQAGVFGLLGAVLGVFFGTGVTLLAQYVVVHVLGYDLLSLQFDPLFYLGLLVFGFVVGLLSGFFPSWGASKLQIVETFRQ